MDIKELLKEFLNNNNLIINGGEIYFNNKVKILENKEKKSLNDYFLEEYLKSKENEISGIDINIKFANFMLKKGIPEKKICNFLISKVPSRDKYSDRRSVYEKRVIDFLKNKREFLLQYINRPKFIEEHIELFATIFKNLNQKDIENILEEITKVNAFKYIEFQNKAFKVFKEYSGNIGKYYHLFNHLLLDEKEKNFFEENVEEVFKIVINNKKCNSFNLDKEYDFVHVKFLICSAVLSLKGYPELSTSEIVIEQNADFTKAYVSGVNLNKELISDVVQENLKRQLSQIKQYSSGSMLSSEEVANMFLDKEIKKTKTANKIKI